ncbi:MAG: type VI secretion system-associated FHA domain protein TagH [Pseudomonadota bacterium]
MSSMKLILRRSDDPSQRPVEERPFTGAMMRIGRRPAPSDLGAQGYWQIDDKSISRAHCEIFTRGADLFVSDLGSTNGTSVGGQRLDPQQPIGVAPGQSIALGELFTLTIEVIAGQPAAPTGPAPDPFGGQAVSPAFQNAPSASPFGDAPPTQPPQSGFPSAPAPQPSPATGPAFSGSAIDNILGSQAQTPTAHHVPQDTGGNTLDQVVAWEPNIGSLSTDVPIDWDGGGAASREEDPFGTAAATPPSPKPTEDLWGAESGGDGPAAVAPPAAPAGNVSISPFLEGANLPLSSFAETDPADVLKRAGEIYRQAVLNYAQFLMNRDKVKEEYQVDRTQIGAKNNSPLKFLPAEQAAEQMLKEPMPGFLDGPAAFRDASVDIKRHQIGLMAGTRAALEALLGEVAKAAEANQAGGLKLPFGGKQPSGETLQDVLARLTEEMQGNGRGVVFQAFRSAYDRVTQESED